ncbi:NrsF family protein [Brucella intermedia]|uniref:NrsF family protein n=1 Tax=Brucella intermedia TaxID=94625 RepID=UPI003AB3305B
MNKPISHPDPERATDQLITRLAYEMNGAQQRRPSHELVLIGSLFLAMVAAVLSVFAIAAPRADLTTIWMSWTLQYKVIGMLLLIGGAIQMTRTAMLPGLVLRPGRLLFPAFLFLAIGAFLDSSAFPIMGTHALAVPTCVGTIIAVSIGPLSILLLAMRRGIVTRPRQAGSVAGILSGSLGALAYTLACVNDGAEFVALWYACAVAIVGAIGAIIGAKTLSW